MSKQRTPRRALPAWTVAAGLALVAIVVFAPALRGEFVTWDDNRNFLENPHYRGLGWDHLRWMWSTTLMGHYIPLTWMTFGVDFVLWGMNPVGYHAINLVLHGLSTVLVFRLAQSLFALHQQHSTHPATMRPLLPAALAALFFAVHPLRAESVAWITERRDGLSVVFYLLSVQAYLRHAQVPSRRYYAAALSLFAAALLSKGIAVTLPAVLLILNVYPLRRLTSWRDPAVRTVALELAPFVALSAGFALLSVVALDPPEQFNGWGKLLVSVYSLAWYGWKTVWPSELAPLYEMPARLDPFEPRFLAAYVTVAAFLALVWKFRERRGAMAAAFCYLIIILPLLGVVQNGPQLVADRYTYHAAPALGILLAGIACQPRFHPAGARIVLLFVAVMIPLTWQQSKVWRSSESVWSRVLDVDSTSSIGQIAMGSLRFDQGQVQRAVTHYERGLAYDPDYAEGYNNLGVALTQLGRMTEAKAAFQRALSLRSDYAEAFNNLGIALANEGRMDEAITNYQRAIAANGAYSDAHTNWGNVLLRQGKPAEALSHYATAVRLNALDAGAELNWGVALAQAGDLGAAIPHFQRAVKLRPDNADARQYLERAQALLRQRSAAP